MGESSKCETIMVVFCPTCGALGQSIASDCAAPAPGHEERTGESGEKYWVRAFPAVSPNWRDAALQARNDLRAIEDAFARGEQPIGPNTRFASWTSPANTMRMIDAMEATAGRSEEHDIAAAAVENDTFETLAAQFYAETGFMAPGKDAPAALGEEHSYNECIARWDAWLDERRATEAA